MKRILGSIVASLALLLPLLIATPAAQAQTLHVDTEVAAVADAVINGTILSTIDVELDGLPHTVQKVAVDAVVEGSVPSEIFIEIPGGTRSDGVQIRLSNAAPFPNVGGRVQLALTATTSAMAAAATFATNESDPVYSIVGAERGVFGLSQLDAQIARASADFVTTTFQRPDFVPPARFRVNPTHSGASSAATIAAVRAGFDRWENDPHSAIDFTYAGTTSKSMFAGATTSDVYWEFPSQLNELGTSLAVAIMYFDTNGNHQFDIVMNRNYPWSVGAVGGSYDIETLIAHEVGHGVGLGHPVGSSARDELMFATVPNWVKELGSGDLSGARQMYPDPNGSAVVEPGHSVSANASGQVALAAVKSDGRLQVRRDLGNGLTGWTNLGQANWMSADIAINANGVAYVIGIKEDGRMFTRRWATNGSWGSWTQHSGSWDGSSMPSISLNSNKVVLGAVNRAGQFLTRFRTSGWGGFTTHGATGWAHGDVDIAADGDVWITGVKNDGRLYVRKQLGGTWSGFARQGLNTWSPATAPSISANSNGAVFGAVKLDGRMYTRRQINGSWRGFVRQGVSSWASVDVELGENGIAWLAAEKSWGRLYTRDSSSGDAWRSWSKQGLDTWSDQADPSIAIGAGSRPLVFAVKDSGLLYLRERGGSAWGNWVGQTGSDWAAGS